MKKIILFNPAIGSTNLGDCIIINSILSEMDTAFNKNFLTQYSTKTPLLQDYQFASKHNGVVNNCKNADLKLLCGTNLIKTNLMRLTSDWNIDILSSKLYKNAVCIGCGLDGYSRSINNYTRSIYNQVFSKEIIHSTRDKRTKDFLESLGVKAINTGCPTMWQLTENFCSSIPTRKAKQVLFTLTDYNKSPEFDREILKILLKNYEHIYAWPQGINDYNYFFDLEMGKKDKITILSPNINVLKNTLKNNTIDYIGTRLHAGILAINYKKRSIIISIDNRTNDISVTWNINSVERNDIFDVLDQKINSIFKTEVNINLDAINGWKSQFNSYE